MISSTNNRHSARRVSCLALCAVAAAGVTGMAGADAARLPPTTAADDSSNGAFNMDPEVIMRLGLINMELLALEAEGKIPKSWVSDIIERNIPEVNRFWESFQSECQKFGLSESQCTAVALEAAKAAADVAVALG